MPNKPNRPLSSIVFPESGAPYIVLNSLPIEQKSLEVEIAKRFVTVLSDLSGEKYTCAGIASEPGDVLLRSEKEKNEVFLQIGEAVDRHRQITVSKRNKYADHLWGANEDLSKMYSGVQVAIIDVGEPRDFPSFSSKSGGKILHELYEEFLSLEGDFVKSLPINTDGQLKGIETYIDIKFLSIKLRVRLLRYASPLENSPVKWLWVGSHQTRLGDSVENFKEIITKKSGRYAEIKAPFWLLVYTVDSILQPNEEIAISNMLSSCNHNFERVYLFNPRGNGGEIIEVFPKISTNPNDKDTGKNKAAMRLLPQDFIPKWDDPRWKMAKDIDEDA